MNMATSRKQLQIGWLHRCIWSKNLNTLRRLRVC